MQKLYQKLLQLTIEYKGQVCMANDDTDKKACILNKYMVQANEIQGRRLQSIANR
jgi:hypothetical protein